ncbi:MAG: YeeE/YedE thiosulfate transporter family protein [Alteromonadaceae bacterium]|jgi:uncharacterized membrane protein YedE/YeeE
MPLLVTLLLVCIIGFLAQSIGLCMVRGVNECKGGKPQFLLAILLSGVLAWVAILYSDYVGIVTQFRTFKINIWFLIGGTLFGLGSAFNQGCGVSTLSKLSRGDSKMIFTIIGWLIGWTILAVWNPFTNHHKLIISSDITIPVLVALSIASVSWAFLGDKERRKLWLTMMSIGLIGGFVFLFDPKWPPSGFLHKISHSLVSSDETLRPLMESYFLFISLLIGMFIAAWYTKKFEVVKSNWQNWLLHLMAGGLMGIGASLAMGGNDSQLLLALPALSPGGGVAIIGMLAGIWFGLFIRGKLIVKVRL